MNLIARNHIKLNYLFMGQGKTRPEKQILLWWDTKDQHFSFKKHVLNHRWFSDIFTVKSNDLEYM